MAEYPKEKLWELYEMLPKDLKSAVFSVKNADNIEEICQRYKLKEEQRVQIGKNVIYTLLGILPPDDFQEKIEKDAKLDKKTAKQVALWINRLIFLPVRPALEGIYKIAISQEKPSEKKSTPEKTDIYREKIE